MDISLKDAIELVHQMTGTYRPVAARCIAGALARGAIHAQYETLIETLSPEVMSASGVDNGPARHEGPELLHQAFWRPEHANLDLLTAPILISRQSLTVGTLPKRWDIEAANSDLDARCWLISEAFGVTLSTQALEGVFGDPGFRQQFEKWPIEPRRQGRPETRYIWALTEALIVYMAEGGKPFEDMTLSEIAAFCEARTHLTLKPESLPEFRNFLSGISQQIRQPAEYPPLGDDPAN